MYIRVCMCVYVPEPSAIKTMPWRIVFAFACFVFLWGNVVGFFAFSLLPTHKKAALCNVLKGNRRRRHQPRFDVWTQRYLLCSPCKCVCVGSERDRSVACRPEIEIGTPMGLEWRNGYIHASICVFRERHLHLPLQYPFACLNSRFNKL